MTEQKEETDPDSGLVKALQAGEDAAFDALLARYQEVIFRFIRHYVFIEVDARDLTQEVFVRVFFHIGKFKPGAKFSTWLHQIALNLCRDHGKSRRTKESSVTTSLASGSGQGDLVEREFAFQGPTPAENLVTLETMTALEKAIAQLPEKLRSAFILAVLEEKSHVECAAILETTPKSVEMNVYRARKLLLEQLGDL